MIAVVTGAAHGIGLAIAKKLGALGASLAIADLDGDRLEKAASELRADGLKVATSAGDLSREENVDRLRAVVTDAFGAPDVLVNNAGGGIIKPFLEHTPDTLRATIDRNLWTAIWCTRAFLPAMVAAKYGRIINIGADSVRSGLVDHAAYNAAKGGVHAMTSGLAREFAKSGVTVNTVSPCVIATDALFVFQKKDPALAQKFIDPVPMGRAGTPEEVAAMVGFLAGRDAGFVTGQTISVNGGSTMI